MIHEGGCLCGALRYRAEEDPIDTGYCHCRICQHSTGAPVLAWASFRVGAFRYTSGEPAVYRSSTHGHREFCRVCGTQIAYRESRDPETVEINVGSLEEPAAAPPRYHIWCRSRIPWFDTADELARFDQARPHAAET